MAQFLNTSGTNYHLEELIKNASERLILITPYLQINDRIKELLIYKNSQAVDIHIIYGKNKQQLSKIIWLKDLKNIKTSFCNNLHAKCYFNETECIISSMNLYTFSQVNNNEMSIWFSKISDEKLYLDTLQEIERLVSISEQVQLIEKDKNSEQQMTQAQFDGLIKSVIKDLL